MGDDNDGNYSSSQIIKIKIIYIFFTIIWLIIIIVFKLFDGLISFILLLPPLLFLVAFLNINKLDITNLKETLQTTFIVVGLITAIPLLQWATTLNLNKSEHIKKIIILAMIFTLISYLHVWIPNDEIPIWKHFKSCCETTAVTLYIYALLLFFTSYRQNENQNFI